MKPYLSEKNIVVLLFILVLVSFSLAQENTREVENAYTGRQQQVLQLIHLQKKSYTEFPSQYLHPAH